MGSSQSWRSWHLVFCDDFVGPYFVLFLFVGDGNSHVLQSSHYVEINVSLNGRLTFLMWTVQSRLESWRAVVTTVTELVHRHSSLTVKELLFAVHTTRLKCKVTNHNPCYFDWVLVYVTFLWNPLKVRVHHRGWSHSRWWNVIKVLAYITETQLQLYL